MPTWPRFPAIHSRNPIRFNGVPPENQSDTLTAESVALQVIQENAALAQKYASGDLTALGTLQQKAVALAAGRIGEKELENTLMRKLGASY